MEALTARGLNRRRYLATVTATGGALTSAGCTAIGANHGVTAVILYSVIGEPVTVSVTITEGDADEPRTERTAELSRGENLDPVNSSKLPTNSSYTIEVDVEDGTTERYDWSDPNLERSTLL